MYKEEDFDIVFMDHMMVTFVVVKIAKNKLILKIKFNQHYLNNIQNFLL